MIRLEESEHEIRNKDFQCDELRQTVNHARSEVESRIDYYQFERICDELQRALDREKQAQDLQ